jgi:hypothetical protein
MTDCIKQNEFDTVYDSSDADEIIVIRMTRRQLWHLDDWRAEHQDRYPKRYAERQAALEAIAHASEEEKQDDRTLETLAEAISYQEMLLEIEPDHI